MQTPPSGSQADMPESIGPFRVTRRLGDGGLGGVFEVVGDNGRMLACKRLHSPTRGVRRFVREYDVLNSIDHHGIPAVHSLFWLDDGTPAYTMDRVNGRAAQPWAKDHGRPGSRLRTRAVVRLVSETCPILHHLHSRGFVHRDVKSSNVLVDPSGAPHLVDFGAVLLPTAQKHRSGLVGTYSYAPPEQHTGGEVGPASDVYALGVLLYRMLTGQHPIRTDDRDETIRRHLHHTPRPPSTHRGISEGLSVLVMQMLSKDPFDRPGDCLALGQDLLAAVGRFPTLSEGPLEVHSRALRRPLWDERPGQLVAFVGPELPLHRIVAPLSAQLGRQTLDIDLSHPDAAEHLVELESTIAQHPAGSVVVCRHLDAATVRARQALYLMLRRAEKARARVQAVTTTTERRLREHNTIILRPE